MTFHPEQRSAALNIINNFQEGVPFAVLLAQMQSGKTGSYLFTAFEMIRLGIVDRVVVICGSAETSLREQAKDDALKDFKYFQCELLKNQDTEGVLKLTLADIGIHFSNDLSEISSITTRTLIIHEECHMAQSKGNKPYKEFYRQNGLERALMGDFTHLRESSIYILGVSATPFSELVANYRVSQEDHGETEGQLFTDLGVEPEEKYIHRMLPGSGYVGVPDFYRSGSIKFESQKIESHDCHFFQVLTENRKKYQNKYCIVRTFESKETHAIILEGCKRLGYDCIHSFGGEKGIKNILEDSPDNLTVVHISGRCRMGQVIDKKHLGMVYESSNSPNADTLLQGLVGRVCGYDTNINIDVYVSLHSEEHIVDYSRAWSEGDIESLEKISKAMNLCGSRKTSLKAKDKNGIDIMPIHPICIPGDLLDIGSRSDLGWQIHQCLSENPELIKCQEDASEIKKRILDSGKFHKATRTDHEEDEKMLMSAVSDNKRVRPGKLRSVNNSPQNYTLDENPFILYKKKGSRNYYLGGWVLYREEVHSQDEIERPTPKISPECNYIPSVETLDESKSDVSQKVQHYKPSGESNRQQSSKSQLSSEKITEECEIIEIGPMPSKCYYVDTTQEFVDTVKNLNRMGIKSYKRPEDTDPVSVHLKMSVFSKEEIHKIKKQLKSEIGIKLNVIGNAGRPRKCEDYRKYKEVSW